MLKLSVDQIIKNIEDEVVFEAVSDDYSFTIKMDSYVHYVCAAVHDGHQLRKELWGNCLHSTYERWYEDDPATKYMVQSQPIVIAGLDSRFEYDLNRAPENAIYEDAWGKQLWKEPLSEEMKEKSLSKHRAFYRVVNTLMLKLSSMHPTVVVYDMHSYNWRRWSRVVPTWNLGTQNVDNERFGSIIEQWRQSLSEISLPENIESSAAINNTFYGNGYFLKFITSHFENILVLATEIAKVYCHEYEHRLFPDVIEAIAKELEKRIPLHAQLILGK